MKRPMHKYVLLVLDGIVVNICFLLALDLHGPHHVRFTLEGFPFVVPEVLFFLLYTLVIAFIFYTNQLYKLDIYLGVVRHFQRILKSLIYAVGGIAIASFFSKSPAVVDSRLVILYFFLISLASLVVVRIVLFRLVYGFCCRKGIGNRKAVIVGAGKSGVHLGSTLTADNPLGLRLVGFLDDARSVGDDIVNGLKVLGNVDDVADVVKKEGIREAILCLDQVPEDQHFEAIDRCTHTQARVLVGSAQFSVIPRYVFQEHYDGIPVFGAMNSHGYLGRPALKRALDVALAVPGVILLSPLFLFIAVLIKIDSRGPVFYRQQRIGKNGVPFTFYKFRSMIRDSDRDKCRESKLADFIREGNCSPVGSTKIVDDKRVTRVGRFLRKTSLDELPQLFNVIKGEMSLVGPRPCLPYEWDKYAAWHRKRLEVIPGCTGVWQVFARSRVGFRDMVVLDLFYGYNVSFPLDVWLILKTIPVMLFGSGGK